MTTENHFKNDNDGTRNIGQNFWSTLPLTSSLQVLLVFLALYLPFINKAFHIDDYSFITMGRMIGWNPFHAFPINYDYAGGVLPNLLPYEITHPLIVPYFIKIVSALFGENEVALHLAFIIFPLIAIFSFMKLNSLLFSGTKRIATLLAMFFLSMPAFLVNAQNIMSDIPTLAFLLLAVAGYFDGFIHGSRRMTYLGGVSLTLALFTSYQMLAFVVVLFLYALWQRKVTVHVALSLAIPVLFFLMWLYTVYSLYDIIPVFKSNIAGLQGNVADEIRKGLIASTLIRKIVAIFAFIGAAMIWVLPLHYALTKKMRKFFVLFFSLILVCYPATYKVTGYPLTINLALSAFVALGLLTIVTLVLQVWQLRKNKVQNSNHAQFLLFWLFCVIGYCIALLPHCSARYLLPAFPPALMLIMNDPAWSFTSRTRRAWLSCALSGTILFALASAYSDYMYAGTYRDFAAKTKAIRAGQGNSYDVWYIGEWGMHYYMEKAGARYLHADSNEPATGDYVVIPEMPAVWNPSPQIMNRMVVTEEQTYSSRLPLRLFNRRSRAGFYAHFWGMLPFAFSSEPDEVFQVLRVVR